MARYRKIMFQGPEGRTAGIVVDDAWIERNKGDFIGGASRLYPMSECRKMTRMYISPDFDTWDEAFAFEFSS